MPGERSGESLSVREGTRRGLVPTCSRQSPRAPCKSLPDPPTAIFHPREQEHIVLGRDCFPCFFDDCRNFWPQDPRLWNGSGLIPIPSAKQVAVLPFSIVGSDPETTAFGAGLTETLTAKLTQLTGDPSLQVVPLTEIRARHIGTVDDARKEFGANLALEGSLHKSGEQIRVNYILVDAQTLRQIRASSLTISAADPFGAQDAVVEGAIRMLGLKVQERERQALESHGTQVARAYDYYLQGRGYLQNYDRVENLDSAIQVFERALALDPNYALAHAGLGDAYWKKYESNKDPAWIERSRKACEEANRLDRQLSSAHVCLGTLYAGTGTPRKQHKNLNAPQRVEKSRPFFTELDWQTITSSWESPKTQKKRIGRR